MNINMDEVAKQLIEFGSKNPIISFHKLTDWGEVKKIANIVDVSIDGVDFSAKIEKQFFSAALPELGGVK